MFFFLCAPISLRDLVEMGTHRTLGPVGAARRDGLVDRRVGPVGDELLARHAQGDGPLLGQPSHDRLVDRGEDRVARDHRQHVVECDVGPFERMQIVDGLTVGLERALQGVEIIGGGVLRGVARQADLEEGARLLEVTHAIGRPQQVSRRTGQRFEDHLGRGLSDASALAAVDRHQSHLLQREQRLAHRRPADAELLHQIALGRQLVADRIPALVDHRLEAARDLFIEPAAPDDAEVRWYTYHTRQSMRAGDGRSRPLHPRVAVTPRRVELGGSVGGSEIPRWRG